MLENISNLQKRIVGAGLLLLFGIVFFADLFIVPLNNYLATGIYYVFSAGIIWELVNLIESEKTKFKGKIFLTFIFLSILIFQNQDNFLFSQYIILFSVIFFNLIFIFIKKQHKFKKKLFDILALIIYFGALIFINKAMNFLPAKIPDPLGAILLLSVFVITITTDIGAYFIGKKFGKKKFAPIISPNKTWAGFFGGVFLSTIIGVGLFLIIANPFGSVLKVLGGWYIVKVIIFYISGLIILSIIAQLGDLFESYLKRLNNVKDSGSIIVGHGGLLDRSFFFLS